MNVQSGLEGVIACHSAISLVDGQNGRLVYRGYWAKELALHKEFEEVCYLLWHGSLPTKEEVNHLKQQFLEARKIPIHVMAVLVALPKEMDMMSVIRTCISALASQSNEWPPTVEQAIQITALIPTIITARISILKGEKPIEPHETLGHIANYLYMLHNREPNATHSKALEAYCILTMEHGLNASTFAARVISSTESDIVSAITGAIGAMKGPLHGGAPSEVTAMLEAIETKENAEEWIRTKLKNGEKLMGFGHRVYKTKDPRAEALQKVTAQLTKDDQWLALANAVEETALRLLAEYKPGRKLYTNVEFYAAAVLRAVDMPSFLFTPTFTVSRVVGWTANVLEQAENNRIYRPQSLYNGVIPGE
ncbi:citrate synthase/methylcitrate synthase [Alkalihalobacterium bogoriense]|uniref:citrate synthase/methylcitrate synthase n=1 Tax=Alkalihalobacterium bogoriense TaxID=246272 RepID=UPI00047BE7B8|nr:citrate synthase/methylcitrate synthase [Alkalihalobacterium bogoriense]